MKPNVSEVLDRVKLLLIAEKPEEADEQLEELLAQEPDHAEALLLAAESDIRKGNLQRAQERLTSILERVEDKGRAYFDLGTAALLKGDAASALGSYDMARAAGYASIKLALNTAACYAMQKDNEAAIRYCQAACDMDEEDFSARNELTALLLKEERVEEGIRSAEKLAAQHPDRFEGTHYLTAVLLMRGHAEDAKKVLDACKAQFADDPLFRYDTAKVLEQLGHYQEALDCLAAMGPAADHLFCRRLKAGLLLALARTDEAQAELEQLCELSQDTESRYMLATLLYAKKDFCEAEKLFRAVASYQDGSRAYYTSLFMCASALGQMGKADDAKAAYESAERIFRENCSEDPDSAYLYLMRSYCCKELGRYSEAMELLAFVERIAGENEDLRQYSAELNELSARAEMV